MYRVTPDHAKLSPRDVRQIRYALTRGEHSDTIAMDYGVSKGAIQHIKFGRSYKEVLIEPRF